MPNINGVAEDIVLKSDLVNFIYPVGSYYWSANATEPSELFGGTWEQVKDRFVLAAGDTYITGNTGGEAEHTLTTEEMPEHWHKALIIWNGRSYRIKSYQTNATNGGAWTLLSPDTSVNTDEYETGAVYAATEGGNKPHNNMPPYEVAYCWKRIA